MIITCKCIQIDKYVYLIQIMHVYTHICTAESQSGLQTCFFGWTVHLSRPAEHAASGGHRNRFNKECGKAKSWPMKMRDASKNYALDRSQQM